MFDPERNVSEELVEIRHAIYHAPDFVRNIANLLSLQEMDVRQRNLLHPEDLHKIRTPTLIVWGTNNPFGGVAEATGKHENKPEERRVGTECVGPLRSGWSTYHETNNIQNKKQI